MPAKRVGREPAMEANQMQPREAEPVRLSAA